MTQITAQRRAPGFPRRGALAILAVPLALPLVAVAPAAAHPDLAVTGTIACESAMFTATGVDASGPVTFTPRVTRDGADIALMPPTFTQTAPGTTDEVTWPLLPYGTHTYAAFVSFEGQPEVLVAGPVSLTCGTPPPPVEVVVTTPGQPVVPVVEPGPTKTPPKAVVTCATLRRAGAGPRRYTRLGHYYRCLVPRKMTPPKKRHNPPAVAGEWIPAVVR